MKAVSKPDEWLMAEVAGGRREQLEPLVRRYASPLLTFIRRMVGDHHRSEELFQEVFLAVWQKRRQFQNWRPFKPWLYAIAVNRVRAYLRSRPAVGIVPITDGDEAFVLGATGSSPSDTLLATETACLVTTAVHQLPPKQQTVVVLRVWAGLTYSEIALALDRTEETVRSHMHHALAALREVLEPRLR
jgi:RNA polymerase sigma-70 factor, ECF subfamily